MEKYRAIPQGYMTVGEVAKKMGVTVRALQYYDREKILTPSCFSEGGRRLYSDKDIVELHQILALKSLGFSFDEIKKRTVTINTPQKAIDALTEQSKAIQTQIDALSQSLREIEVLKEEIKQIQTVDFAKYADIIVNLQMGNKYYNVVKYFDKNMIEHCHKNFNKETGGVFINKFNMILQKIEEYTQKGIEPTGKQGQTNAKEFWQLITEFTGGDMSLLPQLMNFRNMQTDDEQYINMQITLNNFIEPALNTYFTNSGTNPFENKNE